MATYRIEKDSTGELNVPADALYGIYTQRVINNFGTISGHTVPRKFIENYLKVKKAYAIVNFKDGKLKKESSDAIVSSCDELLTLSDSEFKKLFFIDQIQSGGGTSTNMLVNEVIGNIAEEKLGGKRGENKIIHPNDHVNMSQSSNDTFPAVMRLTTLEQLELLEQEIKSLNDALTTFANENSIEKAGRTHLQDAVTIDSRDEFLAFARSLEKDLNLLVQTSEFLLELNLGATATGSMQNVNENIRNLIIEEINKLFNFKFVKPESYFEVTSSSSDFSKISGVLEVLSNDLIKISADFRMLVSGPRAGINELSIPEVQAGSSIMPGKVNPSIPEALAMVCFRVIGNNTSINLATRNAQLQLQAFNPTIAFSLFESIDILTRALRMFREKCVSGMKLNTSKIEENFKKSFVYATDYSEKLGYAKVAELVKKANKENLNLKDLIDQESELT